MKGLFKLCRLMRDLSRRGTEIRGDRSLERPTKIVARSEEQEEASTKRRKRTADELPVAKENGKSISELEQPFPVCPTAAAAGDGGAAPDFYMLPQGVVEGFHLAEPCLPVGANVSLLYKTYREGAGRQARRGTYHVDIAYGIYEQQRMRVTAANSNNRRPSDGGRRRPRREARKRVSGSFRIGVSTED